jgi:hypothetical protein
MASSPLTVSAETGPLFAGFAPYVGSIDNAGVVVFQAATTGGGTGVFSGDGGEIRRLLSAADGDLAEIYSHPDTTDARLICFYAKRCSGGEGVYLAQDGDRIVVAETGDLFASVGPLGPTMNLRGEAAFRATLITGQSGIFSSAGRPAAAVALTGLFLEFHGLPVITQDGSVIFRADLLDGREGIYRVNGAYEAIVETGNQFKSLGRFPSVNKHGTVAFAAVRDNDSSGIFKAHDGRIEPALTSTEGFESFRGALIDASDAVTFFATPVGGQLGIYSSSGERLIGLGDPFLGSPVTDFALNPVSMNDSGQIGIRLALEDGRQYIVRSTSG